MQTQTPTRSPKHLEPQTCAHIVAVSAKVVIIAVAESTWSSSNAMIFGLEWADISLRSLVRVNQSVQMQMAHTGRGFRRFAAWCYDMMAACVIRG